MAETAARQSSSVDFVLSCSICQETLSAIYADLDGDDGLRKDAKRTNGSITKLWLTECAHITCGKHLEGGGLQAEDQPPKAPCPLCSVNNGDQSAKILYWIRGAMRGQYDESIPAEYFQVPAPQLGGPGNEALRVCQLLRLEGAGSSQKHSFNSSHFYASLQRCMDGFLPQRRN
ncbi:MAG: hypothetical protein LQ343_006297 [Gyalolechia ehrenbergii]|nr:MAG: hypothetical protein LQ343_006297 [Gyalolechia ehrenbergii]